MKKNYQNTKTFLSSYNVIYNVEIVDHKMIVSENKEILWSIVVDLDNPMKFKNKLFIDVYKLLDHINSVRGLFTIFKQRWIILSPKQKKDEIK